MEERTWKKHYWLVIGLLSLINFLFAWKYGARAGVPGAGLVTALGVLAHSSVTRIPRKIYDRYLRFNPLLTWGLLMALWVAAAIVVYLRVPLEQLNVDRWSVIASFWQALDIGEYPYFAESHMGNPPGPMPVYFVVAYLFYQLGLLELLALIGPALGLWWLARRVSHERGVNLLLIYLGTSLWLYWEILTRSNILTYSTMVVAGLAWWERSFSQDKRPHLGHAALTGLLLSTRSIFALAYLVVYGSKLRRPAAVRPVVLAGLVSLLVFSLTFLPLYLSWPNAFWQLNPFIVQSDFLIPGEFVLGFFAVAGALLFIRFAADRPFLTAGYLLFGVILVYALYHVLTTGFEMAYFGSKVDLSYFLFSVPFLCYGLARAPVRE